LFIHAGKNNAAKMVNCVRAYSGKHLTGNDIPADTGTAPADWLLSSAKLRISAHDGSANIAGTEGLSRKFSPGKLMNAYYLLPLPERHRAAAPSAVSSSVGLARVPLCR